MTVIDPKSASVPLTLRLFGPMQVLVHGRPLPHLRSRKALWLLALLALRQDRPVQREWLAGTLWPDTDQGRAFTSLRATLSELRGALGDQGERVQSPSRHALFLDLTGVDVDLPVFDAAMRSQNPEAMKRAVALYRGSLLEGCNEEWVVQEREPREQECLQALQTLADAALAAGDHGAAVGYYQRAVSIDPWREGARRGWMEALAKGGDRNAAMQVYRDLRELLRSDPGAMPDEETSALYARLRTEARRSAHVQATVASHEGVDDDADASGLVNGYLPSPLTHLIGREQERIEVTAKLRGCRLVTLTGPGGIGKTRLAIEVAAEGVQDCVVYPDGVWLVALDSLSEGQQIVPQIAAVLGIREEPGRSLREWLSDYLRTKRLLLVLDNCEHLLEASARVISHLLWECARVRILTTSREALGIIGEAVFPVPSLAAPDPKHLTAGSAASLQVFADCESIQLFVERAQERQKGFVLTQHNAMAVAQVCFQLDGIPLAIELAAARVSAMTVEQIALRLDDRLSLLTVGSRTAPPRQQTLRATLDWSYTQLSEQERLLLCRLAVFAGGWSLEAAEFVCGGDEGVQMFRHSGVEKQAETHHSGTLNTRTPEHPNTESVLDLLTSLVSKSLVLFAGREPPIGGRYCLLETVRQYVVERLEPGEEMETLKIKHRDWCVTLAETANLMAADPQMSLQRLDIEYDNVRAALAWSTTNEREAETGLRLASAFGRYWFLRNLYSEGRTYLEQALKREGVQSTTLTRARALNGAGILASCQREFGSARTLLEESLRIYRELAVGLSVAVVSGNLGIVYSHLGDYASARTLYEESLGAHRELGDRLGMARMLNSLGDLASQKGDYSAAQALLAESLSLRKELDDRRGIAVTSNNLGVVALYQGDMASARALYEESLRINRELEDRQGIAVSLGYLGNVARNQGNRALARELYEESQILFEELGDHIGIADILSNLAAMAHGQGDFAQAHTLYTESLNRLNLVGEKRGVVVTLDGLAMVLQSQVQVHKAVCLYGAIGALCETTGIMLPGKLRDNYEHQIQKARLELGAEGFVAAWEEGRTMTLEQAVAYALKHAND